jgi:hypothetical protein
VIELFTVVGLLIVSLVALGAVQGRRRRFEARRFQWQFGAYEGGRLVHAVPVGDIQHIEDHPDDCVCAPWSERFERGDGSYGDIVYHHRVLR